MKLSRYTFRNLLLPLSILMIVWACVFYCLVLHEVNDETNDTLQNYKEMIIRQALADSTFLKDHTDLMTSYYIREIPSENAVLSKDKFYDSTKYIEIEREHEPVRVLLTNFKGADGKYYELRIEMSTLEKEDLVETVLGGIIILYILLLCCILTVIHYVFKKSFRPLYAILDWLNPFHPGSPVQPLKSETVVEEFEKLNKAYIEAAQRGVSIYEEQKQFVENASHELQTPLAVCMNKLELLSENPDCTESQLTEISGIYQSLSGLSRLNKSLLLLSRIENNQFPEVKEVSVNRLVKQILEELSDIYEEHGIHVAVTEQGELNCRMNEMLATVLITNLLKNAFLHNHPSGEINIRITSRQLMVENTSDRTELDREKLFQRFGKQSARKESTGLGLAIVRSITHIYNVGIRYDYNGRHIFILTFP